MTQTNLFTKQKQTHRHRKYTSGCQEGWGGMDWEFGGGGCRCELLHIEWINNRVPTVYHKELYSISWDKP